MRHLSTLTTFNREKKSAAKQLLSDYTYVTGSCLRTQMNEFLRQGSDDGLKRGVLAPVVGRARDLDDEDGGGLRILETLQQEYCTHCTTQRPLPRPRCHHLTSAESSCRRSSLLRRRCTDLLVSQSR
jgi:hypothetical protein